MNNVRALLACVLSGLLLCSCADVGQRLPASTQRAAATTVPATQEAALATAPATQEAAAVAPATVAPATQEAAAVAPKPVVQPSPATEQAVAPATTAPAPAPAAQADSTAGVRARILDVRRQVADLAARWGALPGDDADKNRVLMRDTFAAFVDILPRLRGTQETNSLQQEIQIIEASRAKLDNANLPTDPAVGDGLRAAYRAVADLNQNCFGGQDEMNKKIDAIRDRIVEMDSAHGAEHRIVARQTVGQISDVVGQMSQMLMDRLGIVDKPTAPATQPGSASRNSMAWTSLCELDELVEGTGKYVEVEGFHMAVFRVGQRVFIIDNYCPHAGGNLAAGSLDEGCVVCPWHQWAFHLETGRLRSAPGVKITTYSVRMLVRDGMPTLVQADLPKY